MNIRSKQAISVRDDLERFALPQTKDTSDPGYWGSPEVLTRYSTCCASMWYRIRDRVVQCSTCGSIYDLRSSIGAQTPDDAYFYMGPHPIIHTDTKRSNDKRLSRRVESQSFKPPHLDTSAPSPGGGKGFSTQMRYNPTEYMYRNRQSPFKVPDIEITQEERKGLERWLPFFKGLKESPKKAKNLGLTMLFALPNFFLLGSLGLVGIPQLDLLLNSFEQHKAIVDYNAKRLAGKKKRKKLTDVQEREYRKLLTQQRMINRKMEQLKKARAAAGGEDAGWRTIGDKRIYVGPQEKKEPSIEFELNPEA